MATIEELRQWCDISRKLLKTKGKVVGKSAESKDLKKHLDGVFSLLQRIEGDRALIKLYQDSVKTFELLQKEMESSAKANKGADKSDKNEAQTALAGKFGKLETTLQTALTQRNLELETLRKLSEARGAYMKDYMAARQQVELLKVIPKSTPTNAENLLKRVHAQAQQDTVDAYGVARKSLKDVGTEVEKQTSLAETQRKNELSQWKAKPGAQQKLQEAESLYAELKLLVGIDATLKQYRELLDAAQKLAAGNNWTMVLSTLDALDKLPTAKKCAEESKRQTATLQDAPRYGEGLRSLGKLKELLPEAESAKLVAVFNDAANDYLRTKDGGALGITVDALSADLDRVEAATRELRMLQGDLLVLRDRLKLLSSALSLIPFQTQLDNFEALRRNRQLEMAGDMGNKLKASLQSAIPPCEKAKQEWLAGKSESAELTKTLGKLQSSFCTPVKERVPSVMNHASPVYIQLFEEDHDWRKLSADLVKARELTAELREMDLAYQALSDSRTAANKEVVEKNKAIQPALNKLAEAVADAVRKAGGKPFDATQSFKTEIGDAMRTWESAMLSVSEQAALESARDTALNALSVIGETLLASAGPQGIARLIESKERDDAQPQFERQWGLFEKALQGVQARDNGTAAKLLDKGSKLRSTAALNYKQAAIDAEMLLREAQSAVLFTKSMGEGERQAIVRLAAEVRTEIERVKKESKNTKSFGPAFAALTTELAELELMGKSTNLDALAEATAALRALKLRATKFAPTTPGAGISMDKVVQALDDALDLLDRVKGALKTDNPRRLETLNQRVALLKTEVYAAEPEAAMLKIAAFSKTVAEAETDAKTVADLRSQYKALLPTARSTLQTFDKREVAPAYAEQLAGRLKAIEQLAETPSKMYEALTKLQALDKDISAASLDLPTAMAKEQGVREVQHKDEATTKEWEQSLKVFESTHIKEAAAAVKAQGGDKALILELERMAGLARRSAKEGDTGKALQQIKLTMERARQITADPHGPAIGSRNNLPKDTQVYRDALDAFSKGLDTVYDTTAKAVPAIAASGNAAGAKFKKLLEGVKAKFDPNAFEGAIARLAAKGIDDNTRRAAREAALSKLRSVQATLQTNPQIVSLLGNPAAKSEFSVAYRRLQSSLSRLDANIQRCCR